MNFAAWAPPPLPTYQFTAEERAAIDAAPPAVQGHPDYMQNSLWSPQQVAIHWNVPSRFINGISPRNRYRTVINQRSVATIDLVGLVYLHEQMLKRQRRR